MNRGEQRFRAAVAAMQGLLSTETRYGVSFELTAKDAIQRADAPLAELDRTTVKQPLTVQPKRMLAKFQPCGCVICDCEADHRCHGCGAKNCGTHKVGEIPNPVYEVQPDAEGWITHVPGDPMPCDGGMEVLILCADGYVCGDTAEFWSGSHDGIDLWTGRGADRDAQIIAWKPA